MKRINLLRAHGSPTAYLYRSAGCRCAACRGQKVARDRAYRAAHRGQVLEYNRAWREKNREALRLRKRAYDEAHRDEVNARIRRYANSPKGRSTTAARLDRNRSIFYQVKAAGCCLCGETFPACLDFHHIDPSTKEGRFDYTSSPERFLAEMRKCVLVCANCHRKIHHGATDLVDRCNLIYTEEATSNAV